MEPGTTQDALLAFEGAFTPDAVVALGEGLQTGLARAGCSAGIIRRAFGLYVELAQNVARHSAQREGPAGVGRIEVQRRGTALLLSTTNAVTEERLATLLAEAGELSASSPEQLQALRRERLRGPTRPAGGAGLGLIELVRRSGQPLEVRAQPGPRVVLTARLDAGGGDGAAQDRAGEVDVPR
jgi:hypothetical protein